MIARLLALALLAALATADPQPQGEWVRCKVDGRIVRQAPISKVACGPCCLLHSLRFGAAPARALAARLAGRDDVARVRALIAAGGAAASRDQGRGQRYDPASGVSGEDLEDWLNEVRAGGELPALRGEYMERQKQEAPQAQLRRIHALLRRSLRQQEPVVIHLRSFAARLDKASGAFRWEGVLGHFVVVTGVPRELAGGARSLVVEAVDSAQGRVSRLTLHVAVRNFTAARGNAVKWTWLKDRPFLCVTAPSIPLGRAGEPWYTRSVVVLHHAIYRD